MPLLVFSPLSNNWYLWISNYLMNPFPNKRWFLRICSTSLLKPLWEREKLLVKSNFSFFHCVFYPSGEISAIEINVEIVVCKLFQFGRVSNLSFAKGLIAWFHCETRRCIKFSFAREWLFSADAFNLDLSKFFV